MHKKGLTQAEIGLTQPENRPNSNFRRVVACTLQESAEKKTLNLVPLPKIILPLSYRLTHITS